jgi:hypothetical protein
MLAGMKQAPSQSGFLMNAKRETLLWGLMLALLVNRAAFGQAVSPPRTITPVLAPPAAPTVTILTAATGALVRSLGTGSASLDLGRVSYFKGTSAPGESSLNKSRSFVISTRFALRIDCPGSSLSSQVDVTMSRLDAFPSLAIAIDGTILGSAAQTLAQSMACGSGGEHRLEMEVPASTPAGPIGSTVAFVATLKR